MMEEDQEHDKSSLRTRRKKTAVSLSCCFSAAHHRRTASFDTTSSSATVPTTPRKSPSTWIKSKTSDFPEIKGKCRNFISRMARHRRHSSAEFSYDPLSYALNFDHEDPLPDDELPARNFISRLPASPPRMRVVAFDHNQSPRTSTPESPSLMAMVAAGKHDLMRGFEALSANMKRTGVKEPPGMTGEQRRNKEEVPSPRTAAVAKVRRSLEHNHDHDHEMTSTAGVSSNRKILVQFS